jgi:hypothetical protein
VVGLEFFEQPIRAFAIQAIERDRALDAEIIGA